MRMWYNIRGKSTSLFDSGFYKCGFNASTGKGQRSGIASRQRGKLKKKASMKAPQ